MHVYAPAIATPTAGALKRAVWGQRMQFVQAGCAAEHGMLTALMRLMTTSIFGLASCC